MIHSLCQTCKWWKIDCAVADSDELVPGVDYDIFDCYTPDDSEEDNFDED